MRFWFDTEFIEDGHTIELISIGIVAADGSELYRESNEVNWTKASDWVFNNVRPHLLGTSGTSMPKGFIADDILQFVDRSTKPEFWAYYADYDWVVLCQLFGTMMDLPSGWPMYCLDLKQKCVDLGDPKLPEQVSVEHHALMDARWCRDSWVWLEELKENSQ